MEIVLKNNLWVYDERSKFCDSHLLISHHGLEYLTGNSGWMNICLNCGIVKFNHGISGDDTVLCPTEDTIIRNALAIKYLDPVDLDHFYFLRYKKISDFYKGF